MEAGPGSGSPVPKKNAFYSLLGGLFQDPTASFTTTAASSEQLKMVTTVQAVPTAREIEQDQLQVQHNRVQQHLMKLVEEQFTYVAEKRAALRHLYNALLPEVDKIMAATLLYNRAWLGIIQDIRCSIHRYKASEEELQGFDWMICEVSVNPEGSRLISKYRFNLDMHHRHLMEAICNYCSNCVALTDTEVAKLKKLYTAIMFIYPTQAGS